MFSGIILFVFAIVTAVRFTVFKKKTSIKDDSREENI